MGTLIERPDVPARRVSRLAWSVAAACALLAGLLAFDLGGPLRACLALPLVLGGAAALGPVLLATPVEPSPLKLVVVSSLLSPPLVAAVALAFSHGLGVRPELAWAAPFALSALCAVAARGRRIGAAPVGRAALVALALAVGVAVLAAVVAWSPGGLDERIGSASTIVQSAHAQVFADGSPFVDPWLAGGALDVRPTGGALLAAVARPAGIDPFFAVPLVVGWAVLLLTLLGALASAAAFRELRPGRAGARDILGATLVALAFAAGPAWDAVLGGAPLVAPLAARDPSALLGRTYALAALFTGLHAVRRGARPWPGLTAAFVAIAALLQPWLGFAIGAGLCASALAAGRSTLAVGLLAALLPGFVAGRAFGGFSGAQAAPVAPVDGLAGWPGLVLFLAPALALWFVGGGEPRPDAGERRVARRGYFVLGAALIVPVVAALAIPPMRWDGEGLAALARTVAALPAAAGLAAIASVRLRFAAFAALVALPACGVVRWAAARLAADAPPLVESVRGLELSGSASLAEGLDEAFRTIRGSEVAARPTAVLLRGGPPPRPSARRGPPSLAPLLTGVVLWCDVIPPPGDRQPRFGAARSGAAEFTDRGDRWLDRRELLDALYRREREWTPRFDRLLRAEVERGTTLVFVVTEADRRRTTDRGAGPRGPDFIAQRLGAEAVYEGPATIVYVLEPEHDS